MKMENGKEVIQTISRGFPRVRRQTVIRHFMMIFLLNLVFSLGFLIYELIVRWIANRPQVSRCYGFQETPAHWHTTLFGIQVISQIALIRQAPMNPLWFIRGNRSNEVSSSSRVVFYRHWSIYFILTLAQVVIDVRILMTCGVICNDYCFEHWVITIGDWTCIAFNAAFIFISWSSAFRKSFPIIMDFDPTLGNPPCWDFNIKPFINIIIRDSSGTPVTLKGVEFECLLINYVQNIVYENSETEETEDIERPTERTRLLSKKSHTDIKKSKFDENEFVVKDPEIIANLEFSTLSDVPRSLQKKPFVVRIASIKTGTENHGHLQINHKHYNIPPSLLVPDGTILRVRPRNAEDRDLIPITNSPYDMKVIGNIHHAPKKKPKIDVTISFHSSQYQLAENFRNFLTDKGFTVFLTLDRDGTTSVDDAVQYSMYCKYFIILLDTYWVKSRDRRYEFQMANNMSLKHQVPLLLPIIANSQDFWATVKYFPVVEGVLTQVNAMKLDENNQITFESVFQRMKS
eukprot:c15607_g1_i1.p1 GENE.c15607_g1_i1~~c15607_g1_i1.p1  ORF type:complete len:516 (+),score=143.05 c15607_g1_i1:63-1610(+)